MSATTTERVAAGVTLLDEKRPGWWEYIDLSELAMQSTCNCVLGQLARRTFHDQAGYCDGMFLVGLETGYEARAHGFDADAEIDDETDVDEIDDHYRDDFEALAAEWKRVITERRAGA